MASSPLHHHLLCINNNLNLTRTFARTLSLNTQPPLRKSFFVNTTVQQKRTMAPSENPKKIEWLVVIPDFPGANEKRLEVRPQHFGGLRPCVDSGLYKMGGAVLHEPPQGTDPTNFSFAGSTIVISASSREEIKEVLRNDIYAKEGVWDVENAQMWPFLCAFRFPVPGQEEKFPDPSAKQ
ncbi:hypothetical protein QBC35DRAFT_497237 [Podospora australis]|uniref:YCII-related domain-containing protein n=1 Tax=Podospora australis TaxID=1536484 RepID=A0AAN6WUS6_9PEZI|nr:hypothetical protein QBC35DRAFT_497237 [Podospora australis]